MPNHAPGICPGWTRTKKWSGKGCYVCWKEQNPNTLAKRIKAAHMSSVTVPRERKAPEPERSPCIHLGEVSYAPAGCKAHKVIYHCNNEANEASRCTIGSNCGKDKDVASCKKCGLYVSQRVIEEIKTPSLVLDKSGWLARSEVQQTFLSLANIAISNPKPVPQLGGRGIVTCGGGRYNASLFVTIKMIRRTGCTLPIQIWHHGPTEPIDDRVLTLPGVTAHDTAAIPDLRRRTGWPMKTVAWANCGFAEFIFFDADCYPAVDPTDWFYFNPDGAVVFGDFDNNDTYLSRSSYPAADWSKAPPTLNGGHYVIDTAKTWPAISLAHHFDQHDDYWHQFKVNGHFTGIGGYSDQDQFRAALAITGAGWSMWPKTFEHRPGAFLHFGPDGEPAIVHRVGAKFAEPGAWKKGPRVLDWLPGEADAWRFFAEWSPPAL